MHAAAGRRLQHGRFALDRNAGIIRDLLSAAGQGVEQGGLAAVRRPDESEVASAGFGRDTDKDGLPFGPITDILCMIRTSLSRICALSMSLRLQRIRMT